MIRMQISSLRSLAAFKKLLPLKPPNSGCDKIISLYCKRITMNTNERPHFPHTNFLVIKSLFRLYNPIYCS